MAKSNLKTIGGVASSPDLAAQNAAISTAIRRSAVPRRQQIFSQIFNPATQVGAITVPLANVGLTTHLTVEVTAQGNNTDAANDAALTDLGLSNIVQNFTLTDLNNNQRHNCPGWFMAMTETLRYHRPSGVVVAPSLAWGNFANTWPVIQAPATIAKNTSKQVRMMYDVPLAYHHKSDLRGALYLNVLNATANLAITLNPNPFAAANVDSTLAVYKGAAGNFSNVQITVYQHYYDQLPVQNGQAILPMQDIATMYQLVGANASGLVAGQDFAIPYANLRDILSLVTIFNHDGSADQGRAGSAGAAGTAYAVAGSDLNALRFQSASLINLYSETPEIHAMSTRKRLGFDLPPGVYHFDSRQRPVSTSALGNMNAILNPVVAAASAYVLMGWEYFSALATVGLASSVQG